MSGVPLRYTDQPLTALVSGVVAGGQFVDADQTNSDTNGARTVAVSGAGSLLCVGVALQDAAPAGTDSSTDAAARPPQTSIARAGSCVPVTFAAQSKYGDRLKTAASGQATPWVDGTDDVAKIVAINVDPGGVVASGGVGVVSLLVS
jgi:hypothetical protein